MWIFSACLSGQPHRSSTTAIRTTTGTYRGGRYSVFDKAGWGMIVYSWYVQGQLPHYTLKSLVMNQLYRRESAGSSSGGRRKIKHYSYASEDRIGKGYSSVVYRGTNDLTNETVAIKAIDMKGVRDAVSREMLDCEIQALTRLKHPNILRCYDVVRQTSHCYIITEYCNEGDLSGLLKKRRKLTEGEVLKLAKDIVSGFIEMAERQFLHRDLKLANIFMNSGRALLADFGFAKKHNNTFDKEKYNVGSPLYMSPEALKRNIYSVKNDIWSIGIMLYELLHGETPWECKTEKELMEKMVRIPVRFRETLGISESTKQFIRKCLEVSEDQRMSLSDLKEWNKTNTYESLKDEGMTIANPPRLSKQPCSSKEGVSGVLGEVTNRVSSRSQSNIGSYQSKTVRDRNSSFASRPSQARPKLSKTIVDSNNNLLILEINKFRLLFKIWERIKKHAGEERDLMDCIGNEVLRRVNSLMNVLCPDKENQGSNMGSSELGLAELQQYLSEDTNSSIKKYKSVVKEYYKKYHQEISAAPSSRQVSAQQLIKDTLKKGGLLRSDASQEAMVMVFWMVEFVSLRPDVRKEHLDRIIEPKNAVASHGQLQTLIEAL